MVSHNENGSVKRMCMKLSELHGLTANEVLQKAGQLDIVPVDIAQLCSDLQIITQPFNFRQIENSIEYREQVAKRGNILGMVLTQDDDLAILYRSADTKNRKRFTIAHELAHCCLHMRPQEELHIEFRTDEISEDMKELEANRFAGELLIPERSIKAIIDTKTVTQSFLKYLSDLFVVSVNVMRNRLAVLGIKVESEESNEGVL